VIAALMPAMGVVGPLLFGMGADALGLRGALLRVACGGACVGMGAIALAGALGVSLGFGALFAAVLVFALFRSPLVMMADVVALEQARAGGTSYAGVRLFGSLGFLVSAFFAGRSLDLQGRVGVPLAVAGALLVALFAAWSLPARGVRPEIPVGDHARRLLGAPDFQMFLVTSFLAQCATSNYDLCYSLHLRDLGWSGGRVGVAWAVAVICEVALMVCSAPILERFASARLVALAMGAAVVRWALIAFVSSPGLVLAAQPLHALTFGLWWLASTAYTRRRAPLVALATAQGLFAAATGVGSVTGMLTWSALYQRAGGGATFSGAALVSAGACAAALVWSRIGEMSHAVAQEGA
jgi:MFS transporter, PPP family, 3-phenylpropionic acid transporter